MFSRVLLYLLSLVALAAQSSTQTLQVVPLPRDGEVLVSFKLTSRSPMRSGRPSRAA